LIAAREYPLMQSSAASPIDTLPPEFLSFAPPPGVERLGMEELRVVVEPERSERLAADTEFSQPCFPLRVGKIQRPSLAEETLSRDRLLDQLTAKSGHRLVYVIAEAGFGKTTLVADYLRRSQLRAFWYRLDEEETDGLVFLRYLVAACRAIDPRLLARSATLLSEPSVEPIRQEEVLETVLAEIDALGEIPSALVLDDFHAVESVPSVASIVERLIARAPAGLQLVVASRRTPGLSVAALRARGQLAELSRDELRFDESETDRLFRDCYHHALEPDVLHDLQERTDGWAASLQLVRTAVEGRSPGQVRAFVDSLSGSEGHLYDYLAEEVVGELRPELREFLVTTALLEDIDPETAAVASGLSPVMGRRLLGEAEHLGLVSKDGDQRTVWRSHPLVREFLLAQLEAQVGEAGVAEMHRRLATVMESHSWRLAARHWAAAGDAAEVRRVVSEATPTIIGTGDLSAAYEFVTRFPDPEPNPWFDVIRLRQSVAAGQSQEALAEAWKLATLISDGSLADPRLVAAMAMAVLQVAVDFGDGGLRASALDAFSRNDAFIRDDDRELSLIARATDAIYESAEAGSLEVVRVTLLKLAHMNRELGHPRYEGISLLNLSNVLLASGDPMGAVAAGVSSLALLKVCGKSGDISAVHLSTAKGQAHLGRWEEARRHIAEASQEQTSVPPETYGEAAELEATYGSPARASSHLNRAFSEGVRGPGDPFCRYVAARIALEEGRVQRAQDLLTEIQGPSIEPGLLSSRLSLDLQIRATIDPADPSLAAAFESGLSFAQHQQAWYWWKCIRLTQALTSTGEALSARIKEVEPEDAAYLSIQAELVVRRLSDLDDTALERVTLEASLRPERWRSVLRGALKTDGASPKGLRRMVELLEIVGDVDDIARLIPLRKKKGLRLPDAGRSLCRRIAPKVYVEDLGRVTVRLGGLVIPGTEIRKKVLSLLCFLLTRPQFTATREQVFEALWPEMDPEAGANSLNQSAYFLRHVLEPDANDDTSAGYVRSRADLIWLDRELVGCRSADCSVLIAAIRRDPSPQLVVQLAESYAGPYAVDFAYDDWACSFRETLHASYLDRIERTVASDTKAGAFDRALTVAQLALQADPDAEQIELCLLRLYRRMGANAAAAEQYIHYAGVMREQLGMEPPPLESI
jgi:ATP/maltotriose-dependent transcriptional regulator MalT/DNA-binding SARP family transcriptional activator